MWKLSNLDPLYSSHSKEARSGCTRITCRDMRRFEGIRLALSIWRYLLSWSHGGRLSWGSAGSLHSTACHTTEKSTHFTAGVVLKCISSSTHTVTVSERRKRRIEIQVQGLSSISLHVQRFYSGYSLLVWLRTGLVYFTLTIPWPLLWKIPFHPKHITYYIYLSI